MIFLLLSRCKGSKFLTRQYCRVIFRESYDVRTNPIVGNLVHWRRALIDAADPNGNVRIPDRTAPG